MSKKKDYDGLEGSYVIGADPDLKIYSDVFPEIPDKPFTKTFFTKHGLSLRTIEYKLNKMESLGMLKSELRIVKSTQTGASNRTRVYWKI